MDADDAERRGIGLYRGMLYGLLPSLIIWAILCTVFYLAYTHPFM